MLTPRIKHHRGMTVAGHNVRYTHATRVNIPAQWEKFASNIGKVPGPVGAASYGVCWNFDDKGDFDYLSGVEVTNAHELPQEFLHVALPASDYAVFTHDEHVSTIPVTIQYIWRDWMPKAPHEIAGRPSFERYGEGFDPKSGFGDIEIWVPIER